MAAVHLTEAADADIAGVLRFTLRTFGAVQMDRYRDVLKKALGLLATDPENPAAKRWPHCAGDVRSLHLRLAAGRAGAAAHLLFYEWRREADEVVVLRLLHERMDPFQQSLTDAT